MLPACSWPDRQIRSLRPRLLAIFCLITAALILPSCTQPPTPPTPSPTPNPLLPTPHSLPSLTLVPIPTLLPTATLFPTPAPIDTGIPAPTASTETPIPFDQTVVEMTYQIPALDLSRQLLANISSRITLTDTTTGATAELRNQAGVLLELQGALPNLKLDDLPDDCPRCVRFSYALPISGIEASGWLTDTQMLASVENFMAVHLGPHFPSDTIAGLRRSASPYHPAHTIAISETGAAWIWQATDPVVPPPIDTDNVDWQTILTSLPIEDLADSYTINCEGAAIEQLTIQTTEAARTITVICPALSLPLSLLPIYLPLAGPIEETMDDNFLEQPVLPLPLSSILDYHNADGKRLTLLLDGTALLVDEAGSVITKTLSAEEALELVTTVAETDVLDPQSDATVTGPTLPSLAVRGDSGWLLAQWDETPPEALVPVIDELDIMLEALPTMTPTPTEATPSPTPSATPGGE